MRAAASPALASRPRSPPPQNNFDASYSYNRAPVPVFVHQFWITAPGKLEGLRRFVDYALAKPDVYFITMRQLIGFMKNPIRANQLTPAALGCGLPGGRYGTGLPGVAQASPPSPPSPPPSPPAPAPPPFTLPTAVSGSACGQRVARCRIGECCSQYGWCGVTPAHCGPGCQHFFGRCA